MALLNLYELVQLNTDAHGELVTNQDDADFTVGLDDNCDLSVRYIDKILAEFM